LVTTRFRITENSKGRWKALGFLVFLLISLAGCSNKLAVQMSPTRTVLANGLTVIVQEDHSLPVVSLLFSVKAGAINEPDTKAGLASFVVRLLTQGAPLDQLVAKLEFVGGRFLTDADRTNSIVASQVLSKDLTLALDLLSCSLTKAPFEPKQVALERESIISELTEAENDPVSVGQKMFDKLIYGTHPFYRPISGYKQTIKAITRQDLLNYYHNYYVPNNTVLAIVGDIKTRKILTKIKKQFASWEKRPISRPVIPAVAAQKSIKQSKLLMARQQTHIFLGNLGVKRNNRDYYTLLVLDVILGSEGMTARIPQVLRDTLGLAYQAYSNITASAGTEPGVFESYLAVSPENTEKAISKLLQEIRTIQHEPVSDQELADAKTYLTGSYYFDLQGTEAMAEYLVFCENHGLPFNYLNKYPNYINSVTKQAIQRAANKYLQPEAYTLVVVGPK